VNQPKKVNKAKNGAKVMNEIFKHFPFQNTNQQKKVEPN
jgi:hypothetical protein